jgi:hypothetical protein
MRYRFVGGPLGGKDIDVEGEPLHHYVDHALYDPGDDAPARAIGHGEYVYDLREISVKSRSVLVFVLAGVTDAELAMHADLRDVIVRER